MTSIALKFHLEHKARLRRIEEAARRHQASKIVKVQSATVHNIAQERIRRDYETANKVLPYLPLVTRIKRAVATEFGITVDQLVGHDRKAVYSVARHVCVGIIFEMTTMSYPAVARRMGGRDHTTILSSHKRAQALFAEEAIRNRVDQIKEGLQ